MWIWSWSRKKPFLLSMNSYCWLWRYYYKSLGPTSIMCDKDHLHFLGFFLMACHGVNCQLIETIGKVLIAGTPSIQTRQKLWVPRVGREDILPCHAVMNFNHCCLVPDSNWQPTEMKRSLSHYSCLEWSVPLKIRFLGKSKGMAGHSKML
jgi:hypothetical protein